MSHPRHIVEYVTSPPEMGEPLRVWDVHQLWKLAENLPVCRVALTDIPDLDRVGWFGEAGHHGRLTVREIAMHSQRIQKADLRHPILLSADGFVFDGLHRVAKAWLQHHTHIMAKKFVTDPEPLRVGSIPDWLAALCEKQNRKPVGALS